MFLALTLFMYHQDTENCEVMLYLCKRGVFAPLFFLKKMALKMPLLKIIRIFAVHWVVLIKFRINQRIKI
nr:MAG TPA: hypothetical protein [Caudoviricetes sp.]